MSTWRRGMECVSRARPARFSALCAVFLALAWTAPAAAVLELKRGDPAPAISAATIDGQRVDLAELRGRTTVVLFAEAGQERSKQASLAIARSLQHPDLSGSLFSWIILYTKGSDAGMISSETTGLRASFPGLLAVHDTAREVFGAYHAVAMPSTVIIDSRGLVVHAMAGLGPRYQATVGDALLLAAGKMTAEQFDSLLKGDTDARDEDQRRAERLAQMARKLGERGQYDLAETHYVDALALAPGMIHARLGLADLLLRTGRLDEAQSAFRGVLHALPKSLEAAAGLALVHALRGEADRAEALARDVLERNPSRARAHYVLGLVHEQRGEHPQAARCYRKAAELLQDRAAMDDNGPSDPTERP